MSTCQYDDAHIRLDLRAALVQLTEQQRTVFLLAHTEGMTQAQIAHCMEISQQRVAQLLAAARRVLGAVMDYE